MERSKFTTVVIVALLLLNFGTLAFIWMQFGGKGDHERRGPHGGGPAGFIIRELKLNDEQQDKFKTLRDDHHSRVEDLRDSIRDLRTQLYSQLTTDAAESAETAAIVKEIGEKEKEIQLVTLRHFRDLRAILTAEQKEDFNRIIDEVSRIVSGPHGPPAGGKHHGPPPHDR